ncbi:LOW QUALITY PROTEIN: Zinc finger, C3HC-like [Dillenia turbinata]|uniref:Zinc finger, C3HC-like n=1 Tax=Dillenia turbinata TaxID=194707 RepID=A0AAN8USU6_9MAGN
MAEDPEKRFHSIMDKLFSSPKHVQRGEKRPISAVAKSSSKAKGSSASPTPVCGPWDRGDLLRRLATFKSMTWFAKAKAVSVVNSARRGWVDVVTDAIACEAYGARLFFSTPSSWPQHQVEKAALVFSLKLDNGHKLLCPWTDNACDEALAQFPPTLASLLLSALPIISSSAIDFMQSPQLETFLGQSSLPEFGNICMDASRAEYLGNEYEAHAVTLYNQSTEDVQHPDSPHLRANGQHSNICVYNCGADENMEANETLHSVVLDCKPCGASVGLWAFSTVNRPFEFFKLVGYSEGNSQNGSADGALLYLGLPVTQDLGMANHVTAVDGNSNPVSDCTKLSTAKLLSLTIAGGPPPAKTELQSNNSVAYNWAKFEDSLFFGF